MESHNNLNPDEILLFSVCNTEDRESAVLQNNEDCEKLKELLNEFCLEEILPYLESSNITFRSLQYLSKEDIFKSIPHVGLQAEFREKLFFWRKQMFAADDDTLSANSKVNSWLKRKSESIKRSSKSSESICRCVDVKSIIESNVTGKALLAFYKSKSEFTNHQRDELIRIILEWVNAKRLSLKPENFESIANQIVENFPSEVSVRDYYYVTREKNKNPRGRLYDKYKNSRAKIRKIEKNQSLEGTEIFEYVLDESETDDDTQIAYKTLLARSCNDWEEVCEKWQKTFHLRQKDVKCWNNAKFFAAWPKLLDSRGADLINIDFNELHPNKSGIIFEKWEQYKTKIKDYYETSLKKNFRDLYNLSRTALNVDSEDYILSILLTCVIRPSSRFKSGATKTYQKTSIPDAQESFALHLHAINNYHVQVNRLTEKYYSNNQTLQPFIIVVGADMQTLTDFYVYFDRVLYKCKSFLESLDLAFKTHHTSATILIVLSLIFVMMFGINYGYIKSLTWISVFIIFTVKRHVLLDNFFALVYSLRDIYKNRIPPKDALFDDEIATTEQHELDISKRRVDMMMEKLWSRRYIYDEQSESEKQEREKLNIYYNSIYQDFFMFFFYMVVLLLIVLGSRNSLAYYSTMNVKELVSSYKFGYNIRRVQTDEQVYSYIKNLVRNTNRATDINGQNITNEFGWVSGEIGKILGVIQLRQHRTPLNQCSNGQLRTNCVGAFHSLGRDTESYTQGWKPKVDWFYKGQFWRITRPWIYTYGIESRSMPYFGDMGFYVGGGYIAELGRTYNNSRTILRYLKKNQWLDRRTAVLFIEFTLYNADANLFNIVSIVLEKTPQGIFKSVVKILSLQLLLILENLRWQVKLIFVFFLVLTAIFFYRLSVTVWNAKFKLFISKPWNVVDLIIIIITIITLALFFVRNNYVIGLIQELKNKKKNDFVSFQFAAWYDALLVWISAFLVLLATIRLWKILNFAKMFRVLVSSLWQATVPLIMSFILVFVLIVGLSICLTIINGGTQTFQYLEESLISVMSFSIGFGVGIDAESLFVGGKILGILLFTIGFISICIIAIFFFATTICYHFSKEKDYVEKHAMPLYSFWTFLKEEFKIKPQSRRTGCRLDVPLNNKKKLNFAKQFSTQRCGGDYTASKAKLINEAIDAQIDYLNKYIDKLLHESGGMSAQK